MKDMSTIKRFMACMIIIVLLGSCAHVPATTQSMDTLASQLTKVASDIDSTAAFDKEAAGLTGNEMIDYIKRHNPSSLEPFNDYLIKVRIEDGGAILLLCTKDGKTGLIEDAGCTAPPDKRLWEKTPAAPCEFTMTVKSVCGRR